MIINIILILLISFVTINMVNSIKVNTCISHDNTELVDIQNKLELNSYNFNKNNRNILNKNIDTKLNTGSKLKWAIVALTRPGRTDVNMRNKNLIDKIRPYAFLHNITIIFFSELTFPSNQLKEWYFIINIILSFYNIQ